MPKPAHTRITFSGIFGPAATPYEEWAFGLNFATYGNTAAIQASVAGSAATAFQTHLPGLFKPDVRLVRTRVAQVTELGHVLKVAGSGEYVQGDNLLQVPGTSSNTAVVPLQTACVVSLLSNRGGSTGKGRAFLPTIASPLGSDYRWSTTAADAVNTAMRAFLNALAAIVGTGQTPALGPAQVVSTKGYLSPVTSVRTGVVPDTMRSRRGRIPEAYRQLAL